jgi:hypothetical protein
MDKPSSLAPHVAAHRLLDQVQNVFCIRLEELLRRA